MTSQKVKLYFRNFCLSNSFVLIFNQLIGAFLCTYAAQILNEEVADKEGKTFGDEYLADLDYIEVCEHHKEGYESDVEEDDEDYDEESDECYQEEDDEDDHDYKYNGKKSKLKNTSVFETPLENSNIVYGGIHYC
jgi:hypothetical protein